MSWWNTLGISPNADTKAIKTAYAKLLKENKPDENPTGFQQLHSAYKAALKTAKSRASSPVFFDDSTQSTEHVFADEASPLEEEKSADEWVEPVSEWEQSFERERKTKQAEQTQSSLFDGAPEDRPYETLLDKQASPQEIVEEVTSSETSSQKEEPPYTSEPPFIDEDEEAYEENEEEARAYAEARPLIRKANDIIEDEHTANDLERWQNLLNDPLLYDLHCKMLVSRAVLDKALYYTLYSRVLNRDTLVLLNTFFRWTDQKFDPDDPSLNEYLDEFIDELNACMPNDAETSGADTYQIFQSNQREEVEASLPLANRVLRLCAYCIDVVLFFLGFVFLTLQTSHLPDGYGWLGGLLLAAWTLIIPTLESSKLQATPGMLLFRHKVVNKSGDRIHFFQALWRFACLVFFTITVKFTAFLNIFFSDARVLHDRCSGTAVIKRTKDH